MVFPIALAIGWLAKTVITCAICGGTCYCAKKVYDGYKKGQETKQGKFALKGKALEAKQEENKKLQTENDEWKKKYEENETQIKDLEKKVEDAKNKSNDPNIPEEERIAWRNKAKQYEDEINTLKGNNKGILETIKDIEKKIKDNNNIISGTLSNLDDKHWVWDLFTLDNILIAGGCYLLYKMVKDDK